MSLPKYLLDTNVVSELVRRPEGAVAEQIARIGEDQVFTSIVVASELRFGVRKRGSVRLKQQVEAILSTLPVLPLAPPADRHYAEIRHHLERRGEPIGPNDLLIAAQTRSLEAVVVTANVAEFSRVPGLIVENWV